VYHHAPGSQFILARNAVTTCKGFFLVQSCMIVGFWGSDALLIVGYLLHVTVKPFFLFACTSTRPLYVAICHIYNILYILYCRVIFLMQTQSGKSETICKPCANDPCHTHTHTCYMDPTSTPQSSAVFADTKATYKLPTSLRSINR
jgi:hypothetical protein